MTTRISAYPNVVWHRPDDNPKTHQDLDRLAQRYFDIFGVVLLLPGIVWCHRCRCPMHVWLTVPADVVIYRCDSPRVRDSHAVAASVADQKVWAAYQSLPDRKPTPSADMSPRGKRAVLLDQIGAVGIDTTTPDVVAAMWWRQKTPTQPIYRPCPISLPLQQLA